MQIFLDANVLFTAVHNPQGKAALVVELGQAGLWRLMTSRYAVEEARRNLLRKYPDFVARFETMLAALLIVPDFPSIQCPEGLVAKDQPIYRAAMGGRADRLLTGDFKDFGFLMNSPDLTGEMRVQSVAEFLLSAQGDVGDK